MVWILDELFYWYIDWLMYPCVYHSFVHLFIHQFIHFYIYSVCVCVCVCVCELRVLRTWLDCSVICNEHKVPPTEVGPIQYRADATPTRTMVRLKAPIHNRIMFQPIQESDPILINPVDFIFIFDQFFFWVLIWNWGCPNTSNIIDESHNFQILLAKTGEM